VGPGRYVRDLFEYTGIVNFVREVLKDFVKSGMIEVIGAGVFLQLFFVTKGDSSQ